MDPESEQQKGPVGKILGWIFGIVFLLMGLVGVINADFFLGIVVVVMGLAILPPMTPFVKKKWGLHLTFLKKGIVLLVGFFLFVFGSDSSSTENQSANISESTQAVDVTQETPLAGEESVAQSVVENVIEPSKNLYSVVNVIDGDTVNVKIDGIETVIRLLGINTPETVDPRKPVECFGTEASNKAKEILNGKEVSLESDETQDDHD